MKPEDKCVSLETAKKLKETGFPQETEHWWWSANGIDWSLGGAFSSRADGNIAAPDAQEIGQFLLFSDFEVEMTRNPYTNTWAVAIKKSGSIEDVFNGINESEARAAAWLWLKENKII